MKSKTTQDVVSFIAFNIDGDGSSLVLLEDNSLHCYSKQDTLDIIEGSKGEETKYFLVGIETKE